MKEKHSPLMQQPLEQSAQHQDMGALLQGQAPPLPARPTDQNPSGQGPGLCLLQQVFLLIVNLQGLVLVPKRTW